MAVKEITPASIIKPFKGVFNGSKVEAKVCWDGIRAEVESCGKAKKWRDNIKENAAAAGFVVDPEGVRKFETRECYAQAFKHPSGATLVLTEHNGMGWKYVNRCLTLHIPKAVDAV